MFNTVLNFILNIDKQIFVLINSQWTSPWADYFFPAITDLHKTLLFKTVGIPIILGSFIWRRGLKKGSLIFLFCVFSLLISDGVGNYVFKKTVQRPRPAETHGLVVQVRAPFGGYSFVSNHATNMFNLASFVSVIFPVATVPVYVLASLVAYSRIYNGVHFPTDVFVGALLGSIFGLLFGKIYQKTIERIESKKEISKEKATS